MSFTIPTVEDFQAYFFRDFPYGVSLDTVTNQDILNALQDASINFNECLWANQTDFNIGYLNLAAHYMVMSLRASTQGVAGQYDWLTAGKSVGSVSENFQIPQKILDNPEFAMLSKTPYGSKYLSLILPRLVGQIFSVCGRTLP